MSVPKGERKESKQNFDALYYRVHDDAEDMILNRFHASKEIAEANQGYIREAARELRRLVWNLIYHIKVANSLFPTTAEELTERRIHQEEAIGSCFDILTLYELVMHKLRVKEDIGVREIKNVHHEINSIRSWRTSDNKRFRDLK